MKYNFTISFKGMHIIARLEKNVLELKAIMYSVFTMQSEKSWDCAVITFI